MLSRHADPVQESPFPDGLWGKAQANIDKKTTEEDWRCREAATFAFGSILEGPSVDQLASVVNSGLGFLLTAMKDPTSQVRHTTAWTIGAAGSPYLDGTLPHARDGCHAKG